MMQLSLSHFYPCSCSKLISSPTWTLVVDMLLVPYLKCLDVCSNLLSNEVMQQHPTVGLL